MHKRELKNGTIIIYEKGFFRNEQSLITAIKTHNLDRKLERREKKETLEYHAVISEIHLIQ